MIIPTGRFYGVFALGILGAGLLAQWWPLGQTLIALGVYDGLWLMVIILDGLQARQRRVSLKRQPLEKLSIGRDNPVMLTVIAGKHSATVQLRDHAPPLPVSMQTFTLTLAPEERQDLIYTIHPQQRGMIAWGLIQARQRGPWGFGVWDWRELATQTVAVYPDLVGLRSLSIRLALQNTGTIRQARALGQGTEFRELREYNSGDDLRLIDWKATARRSHPLIRVLEPEREQTLIILLDQGRLMTAQVQGLQRFDWGLNATLALAMAGLNRGDRVGVGVFDTHLNTWLPPERGPQRLAQILEALTPLQPTFTEPDYFGTINQIIRQQTRRALVVILTDLIDAIASAELLTTLTRLTPRYLPFCVTLRDPQLDHCAHQPLTADPTHAYTQAVALDLLQQRAATFATLKRQGVMVLDAPANQISDQLITAYLQLKARNRL